LEKCGVDGFGISDWLELAVFLEAFMNRTHVSALSMAFVMGLAILSGCESDRMNNIPANATLASSGDDRLTYTASADGTIWVYDVDNDRIDYSGPIALNESVTVDPHTKQVMINGRVVSDKLDGSAKHRVYFVAGAVTVMPAP
jgi:hypothetical protein